ncbi:MAG TPA: L-serine ammonia-lyase [Elusimicrobiota bacterium]|nr:L-serine ammonia-lyase [Elusimicrobiota bacterium]
MTISIFDLFAIGVGPSSSHTVGPMRAARRFAETLRNGGRFAEVSRLRVELFGSLGVTGKGHGSDHAVLLGLEGEHPETAVPEDISVRVAAIRKAKRIQLLKTRSLPFEESRDLIFNQNDRLPLHSNGLKFTAFDGARDEIASRVYYSVGGGFVVDEETAGQNRFSGDETAVPYPYRSAADLLRQGRVTKKAISEIVFENEKVRRTPEQIQEGLMGIWQAMRACVERGLRGAGELPGGLRVPRRAPGLYQTLVSRPEDSFKDPLTVLDWVDVYALAVSEENAAGGRVVTAPTNGAAGIVPAVLHFYKKFTPNATDDGVRRFLLTAGAIGILYKESASLSGAEVGCQGEIGVACSMAAGALAAVLGGTNEQVENAAEIGMEHNLGLTCDPVGGLVQIPCIERNAVGAVKAINAARMALRGTGQHKVSLDSVIATMRQTGLDMQTKYKETSRGGLAINVIEC